MRMTGRLIGALVAVAMARTLATATATATPGKAQRSAAAAPAAGGLRWGRCPALPPDVAAAPAARRLRCATVTVPLDYRHPHGRTIRIAVSRLPSATPARRHGVLVLNLGGPGGAGLPDPVTIAELAPHALLDGYDLLSFDPRGVSRSAPVSCGLTSLTTMIQVVFPWPLPGGVGRNAALARQVARQCAARMGAVMPYITTANTARDIDRIRAALGEPRISYLGYSYGTYLGAVYASLFPGRVDRMVLDSATSPIGIWRRAGFRVGGPAVELRFPDFTRWAAARNTSYHLGATTRQVRATYFALASSLDRRPLPAPPEVAPPCGQLTGLLFRLATVQGLYSDDSFPDLARLWQFARRGATTPAGTAAVTPGPPGCDRPDPETENSVASQLAVVCDDAAWPRSVASYQRDVHHNRRRWPIAGPWAADIWPCAFWPNQPLEPPIPITSGGPTDILIVNSLRDPATPLFGAVELRHALGRRARLLAVDQGGHTVYLFAHDPCADAAATSFLLNGTRPPDGTVCPPATASSPPSAASAR